MGIINYTKGDIPFLTSYEPYTLPQGNVVCDRIEDMISFDLRSLPTPTTIDYFVGGKTSYVTTLAIRNITLNTTINVMVEFDNKIFIFNRDQSINTISIDLTAGDAVEYYVELHKETLDSNSQFIAYSSNIKMTVKNYNNGLLTIRSTTPNLLGEKFLPTRINVQ